ncbi:DUF6445 family protein [Leifsonia poae]|uniref:DUF6445 family protein n=1 Tax=Leifsonia poae TaxID=110933 RepID=UPI003D671378
MSRAMHKDLIVVDDFYSDPHAVRAFALKQDFTDFGGQKAFLGRESKYPYFDRETPEVLARLVGSPVSYTDRHIFGKFRIANAAERRHTKIHFDRSAYAANIYLTPGLPAGCGLGLYRHKELGLDRVPGPEKLHELGFATLDDFDDAVVVPDSLNPSKWDLIDVIEPRFNRLLILPGGHYFHAAEGGSGRTDSEGRLSQHFFFETLDR